jgi:hypothetical protein
MTRLCFFLLALLLCLNGYGQIVDSDSYSIHRNIETMSNDCKLPAGNHIFTKAEILPEFPGGAKRWSEFSQNNLDFSIIAKSLSDSNYFYLDSAQVKFVVTKNGDICGLTFLSTVKEPTKAALLDLFSKSPNWKPATSGGRQINAYKPLIMNVSYDKSMAA